jgi:acetyltransferase-like isoleucine patch superfamily enzyme
MSNEDSTKIVYSKTPESAAMWGGKEIRVAHNVFINQYCTFYDLGGLDIADDVMIGPNVNSSRQAIPLNLRNAAPPQSESASSLRETSGSQRAQQLSAG